jgi:hypothetical protein
MVKLSLEMKKRDVVWVSLVVVLLGVGIVFALDANPAVFGHSADEISGLDDYLGGGSVDCDDYPGFTAIGRLGCMQDDEEGSGTWVVATDDCFDTYGGRLPFGNEWYIAMANYDLNDEVDDWEYNADMVGEGIPHDRIAASGLNSINSRGWSAPESLHVYRCFIPA